MNVTVALLGTLNPAGEVDQTREWEGVPFERRPQTVVVAGDSDTLGEVMSTAREEFDLRQFGMRFEPAFIAFYEPNDVYGYEPDLRRSVDLVDDTGRILWNQRWRSVTIAQLTLAAEAGLVRGDTSRWYLVLLSPMGNGFFVDWTHVALGWLLVSKLLSWLADAKGASDAVRELVNRVRHRHIDDIPQIFDDHAVDWSTRGAAPPDLYRVLSKSSWDQTQLGALLGCSPQETEAVLWAHGYVYDLQDGVWKKSQTMESALLADMSRAVDTVEFSVTDNKERLQHRLQALVLKYIAQRDR